MNELIGRAYLEDAIAKAQKRNAARAAREIKLRAEHIRDEAAIFIAQNPFATVATGVVIGMFLGSLVPRTRLGRKILLLGDVLAQTTMAYGQQALAKARRVGNGSTGEKDKV